MGCTRTHFDRISFSSYDWNCGSIRLVSKHGSPRVKTDTIKCPVKIKMNTALSAVTLNKLTIILNFLAIHSTLQANDKYLINSSYFITYLTLVSSCLYTMLKNDIYFIKWLDNTQMLMNCSRQHPGFYCFASSPVLKTVLVTIHCDRFTAVKMLILYRRCTRQQSKCYTI